MRIDRKWGEEETPVWPTLLVLAVALLSLRGCVALMGDALWLLG